MMATKQPGPYTGRPFFYVVKKKHVKRRREILDELIEAIVPEISRITKIQLKMCFEILFAGFFYCL